MSSAPICSQYKIGQKFEFHGNDLWQVQDVIPKSFQKSTPFYVCAKNVKKNGDLGKKTLSFWTDQQSRAKISVTRTYR